MDPEEEALLMERLRQQDDTRPPSNEGRIAIFPDGSRRAYRSLPGGRYEFVPAQSQASPRTLTQREQMELQGVHNTASGLNQIMPDLDEFENLNTQHPTGNVLDVLGGITGGTGIDPLPIVSPFPNDDERADNARAMRMQAITSRLTPLQRPPGSGSSSNMDVGMYLQSLPNIRRGGEANAGIIRDIRRNARIATARSQFYDEYQARERTLNGAESAWRAHLAAHPEIASPPRRAATPGGSAHPAASGVEQWSNDGRRIR